MRERVTHRHPVSYPPCCSSSQVLDHLKGMSHPNVIRYIDRLEDPEGIIMIMEYCPGEPLHDTGQPASKLVIAFLTRLSVWCCTSRVAQAVTCSSTCFAWARTP